MVLIILSGVLVLLVVLVVAALSPPDDRDRPRARDLVTLAAVVGLVLLFGTVL